MDALEGISGLRRGFKAVSGVGTTGQFNLGPETDALVIMRQQLGQFSRATLAETIFDEAGHRGSSLGLHHLLSGQRDNTARIVRLPAGDKVGHHEAALPVVFDVGRGNAPEQLVRAGHLHAGARRLDLEGPDTGRARGPTIIADMEVLSLGLEVTSAGVVSQSGRTRTQVSGGRDDEGRLHRILKLPDLFSHPAGRRTLIEANLTVEGMHGLVLHFPTGVGAFDDVDNAGLVALVGVIIDGDAVTKIIEGDFLRITQAEVHDLEIRSIRLKAEDGATVTGVVFLPFLCDDVETTVADGTPHAAVVADGKAVHVVARKGDAHAKAVLEDLALAFVTILLRILQHPDAWDTGKVDVIVPRHHPGTRAVEDVIKLVVEHLRLSEDAVTLLIGEEANLFGLSRHPLDGPLAGPLLVKG